jgi:glycosyltransferase involved in cell wall biosynthesis
MSCGVPESRIRLLPSGVDLQMFSPGDRDNHLLRQWGIEPANKVVLFMGTIYRFSGLDRVIRGLPAMLARDPTIRLLIAGIGEDEERLRQLAAGCGVSGKVIFAGMQPYALLPAIVRSADVCINPFELNGVTEKILPTKLFQYLACAKPVVATSLPGTVPFLRGENDGVVYASLEEFSDRLEDLLCRPDRIEQLGRAGQAAVRKYDWAHIARQLASWLEEIV